MKTCSKCGLDQLEENFYFNPLPKDKKSSWCKSCGKAYSQSKEGKDYRRRNNLKRLYGITPEQVNQLLSKQGNKCAICRTDTPRGVNNQWHVDHVHATGRIRGILCSNCNVALGLFKENDTVLALAIEYLRK